MLRSPQAGESVCADYASLGLTLGPHPLALLRNNLERLGVLSSQVVNNLEDGRLVHTVAGSLVGAMGILVMIRSGVLAMAIDHSSKHAATSMGFVFVVLDGVGALGALLAGLAGDFNLLASFALAGGLSMAAVGLIALARHS